MGTPIEDFIVASNENDILTRFVNDGDMSMRPVVPTLEPVDGHPGVVELRAHAVGDERAATGARTAEQLIRFRETGRLDDRRRRDGALDRTGASGPPGSTTPTVLGEIRRVYKPRPGC